MNTYQSYFTANVRDLRIRLNIWFKRVPLERTVGSTVPRKPHRVVKFRTESCSNLVYEIGHRTFRPAGCNLCQPFQQASICCMSRTHATLRFLFIPVYLYCISALLFLCTEHLSNIYWLLVYCSNGAEKCYPGICASLTCFQNTNILVMSATLGCFYGISGVKQYSVLCTCYRHRYLSDRLTFGNR